MKKTSEGSERPMKYDYNNTAEFRWLNKPVKGSKQIDNMESDAMWQHFGPGEMSFTREKILEKGSSLKLVCETKIEVHRDPEDINTYGRAFGESLCRRKISSENWTEYNRLSFWVYPVVPGFKTISMYSKLHNDGKVKIPDAYEREGLNFFLLKPDQWNHIVWEIASLARDQVDAIDIIYRLQGNEPGATDSVCFYIDKLELEKVEADYFEGWSVAQGTISFSHTGYQPGASKTAITSNDHKEKEFSIINYETGKTILTKPMRKIETHIGEFQLLDFSEIQEEGIYFIRTDSRETLSFRIDSNVWKDSIWKTMNLFFCERCGFEVPGIHDNCHQDWQCEHENRHLIINGGWHDAGDLSQGLCNTAESTYAMFHLAEKYKREDSVLQARLINEAKWGLDWLMKTRFGDGYRSVWATMDFWTDNIIGTFDDITFKAGNSPFDNFAAAAAEAKAAVVLRKSEQELSTISLRVACEDWEFAIGRLQKEKADEKIKGPLAEFQEYAEVQIFSEGSLASIELFKATGEQKYCNQAFEYANLILQCQQQELTDWDIPMNGFFYRNPEKKALLHYEHRSHIQAPIVALSELCKEFQDHPDWINWYRGIYLFSEYMKKIMEFTQPYGMVPGSFYSINESDNPDYRAQVLNGIKFSSEYYLRLFPVWFTFRGNSSIMLSGAKALSCAAIRRKDLHLSDLSRLNLQWMVGRNPFSQSLMFGEGYNYAPQYSAMSGNMVGSLPVGIQTSENKDVPYWPVNNCYNYKEVWVQPSARWLWIMSDLAGTACISGKLPLGINNDIQILDKVTGKLRSTITGSQEKEFQVNLPEGQYLIRDQNLEKEITLLPGEKYDLNPERFFDIQAVSKTVKHKNVTITLKVKSNCEFTIEARSCNIEIDKDAWEIQPANEKFQLINLYGEIKNQKEPWLIVLIPDGNIADKIELYG